MSNTESKLVSYYNKCDVALAKVAELPYTAVNLVSLKAMVSTNSEEVELHLNGEIAVNQNPPEFKEEIKKDISKIQKAGKKVLISLGGSTMDFSAYRQLVGKEKELAKSIATLVRENKLDGVDIDYEDTAGFNGTGGYNGVEFLIDLTKALREELPNPYIITHAPQPTYFEPKKYGYPNGSYVTIMNEVGNLINWLNVQFYNNESWNGNPQEILSSFEQCSKLQGITPEKLLIGLPVKRNDASPESFIPINQIISEIIEPFANNNRVLGGIMNCQFSSDVDGMWARSIGSELQLVPQNA